MCSSIHLMIEITSVLDEIRKITQPNVRTYILKRIQNSHFLRRNNDNASYFLTLCNKKKSVSLLQNNSNKIHPSNYTKYAIPIKEPP